MKSFEVQANLEEEIAPGSVNHLRAKANLAAILRAQYQAATTGDGQDDGDRGSQLPLWMQVTAEEAGQGDGGGEEVGYGFGADASRTSGGAGARLSGADLFSPMQA